MGVANRSPDDSVAPSDFRISNYSTIAEYRAIISFVNHELSEANA